MGHNSVVLSYMISAGFSRVDVDQRTLGFWGVTAWYQSMGMRLPRA